MLRRELSEKLNVLLLSTSGIFTIFVVLLSATVKADVKTVEAWPTVQSTLTSTQHHTWWMLPLFVVIAGGTNLLRSHIGKPVVWRTVHYLLDEYRNKIFDEDEVKKRDPNYFHRVTLFKHVHWRFAFCMWPWSGWMIPIERSGETTKSGIARFRASQRNPYGAEGVAGQTWARSQPVSISGLVDINSENPSDVDCASYASQGLVSREWVTKRKSRKAKKQANARSLFGIPIEVDGKTWGAIVVDSKSPDEINIEPLLDNPRYSFKTLGGTLSKLLAKRKSD